jgi:methyl coenzyme M reductase alpha subunit
MQIGMSFIGAYHMCAGEAAVADLAFTAKHAGMVEMATILPARRARGPNEPGGMKFGHMADIIQTGFIQGTLIIPRFVLDELRHIADSPDALRRNRVGED